MLTSSSLNAINRSRSNHPHPVAALAESYCKLQHFYFCLTEDHQIIKCLPGSTSVPIWHAVCLGAPHELWDIKASSVSTSTIDQNSSVPDSSLQKIRHTRSIQQKLAGISAALVALPTGILQGLQDPSYFPCCETCSSAGAVGGLGTHNSSAGKRSRPCRPEFCQKLL